MFSQRRRNRGWLFVTLILLFACVAVFFLIALLHQNSVERAARVDLETQVEELPRIPETEPADRTAQADGTDPSGDTLSGADPEEKTDTAASEETDGDPAENADRQSYYLVRWDNHVIKIFFSDETGRLVELEETDIVYETLSEEDQARFAQGIRVETRDELNRMMMDYES